MDVTKMDQKVLFTREEIQSKVKEMGELITRDYRGRRLMVISLLKGSFVFTADLIREIKLPLVIEFMITSSYGHSEETTGMVKIIQDVDLDVADYDVLLVDDIIDSGNTMMRVHSLLEARNPKSLRTCTLLDKPSRRKVDFEADYVGFVIPDVFIVGYGLNYGDYYRNMDHVFAFVDKEA
ncbi:MAG: hypoxanthine phosphoribosyltransferase [delta proteobacterium ML8_F1]|nr:MAG: hypoxanthine phosphoribosyltransferase [delta proteobacterium ML8_F1]